MQHSGVLSGLTLLSDSRCGSDVSVFRIRKSRSLCARPIQTSKLMNSSATNIWSGATCGASRGIFPKTSRPWGSKATALTSYRLLTRGRETGSRWMPTAMPDTRSRSFHLRNQPAPQKVFGHGLLTTSLSRVMTLSDCLEDKLHRTRFDNLYMTTRFGLNSFQHKNHVLVERGMQDRRLWYSIRGVAGGGDG